jgi:thiosulfate/3-mercaptopyruvate sulfurtransferase
MRRLPYAVLVCLTLTAPLAAQEHARQDQPLGGREQMQHNRHLLVDAAWLSLRLDSGVVVVHVGRTDSLYRAAHVPGARFLSLQALATTVNGVPNEFPSADELAQTFRDLGIGDSARVVLYGDDPGVLAARAWVALDVLGHGNRAALLDGGLTAWRAAGQVVDTTQAAPEPRPFTLRWQAERIVDSEWVRAHLGDSTLLFVDARPVNQFNGEEAPCPPTQPSCVQIPAERRGRIPGARSLFWMSALTARENPVLVPMHTLHHSLWEPIGADAPHLRTIVAYCRTGMQASHTYWQARYIGYRDVRLYDASFLAWALGPADRYPVESGTTP